MRRTDQAADSPQGRVTRVADAAGRLTRILIEAVFPSTCPACGLATLGRREPICCEACGPTIMALAGEEYCTLCGRTTGPYERREGLCAECRSLRNRPLHGLVRVGAHKPPLRQMVLDFKFGQAPLDRVLGRLLAAAIRGAPWSGGLDAVVPVPMHWRRKLERRHHPTRALAKTVASDLGLPVVEPLRRTRYSPPQVGLTRPQRGENVRGTFGVVRGARLEGVTVCLIDDVTTTGATLAAASRTLRKAGAAGVYAAVITKSASTRTA